MIHHTKPGQVFFVPYKVRLLKKIDDFITGTIVEAQDIPNGSVYLFHDGSVFFTKAVEGKTFEKV